MFEPRARTVDEKSARTTAWCARATKSNSFRDVNANETRLIDRTFDQPGRLCIRHERRDRRQLRSIALADDERLIDQEEAVGQRSQFARGRRLGFDRSLAIDR